MARKYTTKLITEMNRMLDNGKTLLSETMSWSQNPSDAYAPESNDPGYDAGPDLDYGYDEPEDGAVAQNIPSDPDVTNMINQIRQIALQGIAKLANTPTSPQYDALKKVWQIIDKTVEVKDNKQGV